MIYAADRKVNSPNISMFVNFRTGKVQDQSRYVVVVDFSHFAERNSKKVLYELNGRVFFCF